MVKEPEGDDVVEIPYEEFRQLVPYLYKILKVLVAIGPVDDAVAVDPDGPTNWS